MHKRIMIVAGGDWQVPITKKAKEMGLYVISSNLYEDSPAFAYADAVKIANVLDREANLACAERYKPYEVVTDQSDIAVPTVAYICQRLGLPGIGEDKASLFTNKYKMREFCKKYGFASPDFRLCTELGQAKTFLAEHHRIIIKPIDSQSSRGVFLIETQEDLTRYFGQSMQYSNAQKAVLAEQYVEGTEFTVDGIKHSKGYTVLAVSKKKHYKENPNVAKELFFSNQNVKFDYEKLRKTNQELVLAMGMPFGLTHAEYKYMDGQYYLIEIAARGGGTKISSNIVPLMSGVDSNEALLRMALGESVQVQPEFKMERCAVLKFLHFQSGRVRKIEGLTEIRQMAGVDDIGLNFTAGETIQPMHDDRSRQGYYIAYAESEEKLRALQKNIEQTLQVIYETE